MNGKFKWHMLITSLLPLWISIIAIDIWDIIETEVSIWNTKSRLLDNFFGLLVSNALCLTTIIVISIITIISMVSINRFIFDKDKHKDTSQICIMH